MSLAFAVVYTIRGVPLLYYGDEIGLAGANDPDNRRMMQFDPGLSANQRELGRPQGRWVSPSRRGVEEARRLRQAIGIPLDELPSLTMRRTAAAAIPSAPRSAHRRGPRTQSGQVIAGGRYLLGEPLGRGGHGVVYEAWDRTACRAVALKVLVDADPRLALLFKRGFRALRSVRHPHLVPLYELGQMESGALFLTMGLVRGQGLLAWAFGGEPALADGDTAPPQPTALAGAAPRSRSPRVAWSALREVVAQTALALDTLHEAGVIHRDIKPSNVMVEQSGRVQVVDYGLACLADAQTATGRMPVGTRPYVAPEVILGEPATPASDWRAFGALLYHLLTGDVPSRERIPDRASPRAALPAVPADLDRLCVGLLNDDPGARPVGAEVLAALGAQAVAGAVSAPRSLYDREPALEVLDQLAAEGQLGRCRVAIVHGPAGAGKTALIEAWARRAQADPDGIVAVGRAWRGGCLPYAAVDALVDDIAERLGAALQDGPPWPPSADMAALTRTFPVLEAVHPPTAAMAGAVETPSPLELRGSAFAGLRALLHAVARRHPLALAIDDAQWIDADSRALLRDLLGSPGAPPLVLVLGVRSEGLAAARAWLPRPATEIALTPLRPASARALAARALGDGDADVVGQIVTEARGNPLLLKALARLRDGAVGSLARLVEARRSALGEEARGALDAVVVAEVPLAPALICRAAGVAPERWEAVGGELLAAGLLRRGGRPGLAAVDCVHDRVREALGALVPSRRRRALHGRLARALEETQPANPLALMHHYRRAGDHAGMRRVAVAAADEASEKLAYDRSVDVLTFAVSQGQADAGLRVALGRALMAVGRGADAADAFLMASRGLAGSEAWRLRLRALVLLAVAGRTDRADALEERLQASVVARRPALTSLLPGPWGLSALDRPGQADVAEHRRADLALAVAFSGLFTRLPRAIVAHARGMDALRRAPDPERACRALVIEVQLAAASEAGWSGRWADRVVRTARSLAERAGTASAAAHLALIEGLRAVAAGRWVEGLGHLERFWAVPVERTPETPVIRTLARLWRAEALFRLGRLEELRRLTGDADAEARRSDSVIARVPLLHMTTFAHLSADEPALAERHITAVMAPHRRAVASPRGLPTVMDAIARTVLALYRGDVDAAVAANAHLERRARASLMTRAPYVVACVLDVGARCALAASDRDPRALRRARRLGRRMSRAAAPWLRPMGLGVLGGVAAVEGASAEAARLHRAAALELEGLGMVARAAVEWIRYGQAQGRAGDERVTSGVETLRRLGAVEPLAMARSFAPWR